MKRISIILITILSVLTLNAQALQETDTKKVNMIQFFQYLQGIKDKEAVLKYITAMAYIENLYVDSVDTQKITEASLKGMLEKLDPHSTYATPKEVKDFKEPLDGAFDGIGVQFNILEDTLIVIQPVITGPSEKVGVIAGDRIITVNDTSIAGVKMSKEEIMKRLRGPKGTKVKLGILRSGIKDVLYFTVTRDKIPVKSIDAVYMIRPQIGYIRIGSFGATTYSEFVEGLKELKKKGMRDIIIDLEDNGGGYLQAAVEIANEFLASNELIVYTRGRVIQRQEFRANGNGMMQDGKVVILTNEFTASAAEIVSGAIQDQDRGIIVGRRTFGKGLVQRPVDLPDGSMIRLTVAHYYTPSGRCIQKPYKKGEKEAYAHDLDNRFKRGEFTNADSIHFADSLKFETLKKQRTVYGGGGIMPDHFVPLDTTRYTAFHKQLAAKQIILNSNLKYMDKNRAQLKKQYRTFEDFNEKYQVPESYINSIFEDGKKNKIEPKDEKEKEKTLEYLRPQLKALIARDLWDLTEYFRIWNENSDIIQKALEVLETSPAK
jgi:carboxyl-terminal processing protease